MKNISLKTQTMILLILLILLATVPLIVYYLGTAQSLSSLGTDVQIENSLKRSIDLAPSLLDKEHGADALKRYSQIKVLKNRIVHQVIVFSAFYSAAVIVISLVLGYFFVSRITGPLTRLTDATKKLAHDELDITIKADAGGEVGILVNSFNKMAGDLKTARQQRAIAERRATWQHVARTIAHEIKNPLTPIKLSTERMYEKFLSESKDFPSVIKSTTNTILNEIENLQKLVDTFHRYAKFPDPVLSPESLQSIITETVALFTESPVKITSQINDDITPLLLDKGQIREALTNLIKNAVEAIQTTGRTDGAVMITCTTLSGAIQLCIKDNGCGIRQEDIKNLFQPYFTTKTHGNGIGLALTERIITLNGGSITFESKEGKGTTFTISFPIGNRMA
jgi:two-component system, NtrC family, nitrogen regulation sensor histidine kinase NtrY